MRNYLISLLVLVMPFRLCFAQKVSAFYTLPQGSFVGTVTEQGTVSGASSIYIPYSPEGHTWTSVDPQAYNQWYIGSTNVENSISYTRKDPMNFSYCVPLLKESHKISYQYGAFDEGEFKPESKVYVGDSVSQYMTPARLVCDHTQELPKEGHVYDLVRTPSYFTKQFDTVGVYFNNIDVMYIEGIRIPIASDNKEDTKENLFPQQGSQINVTIYPAEGISGKTANRADKSEPLAKVTLKITDCITRSDLPNWGIVQADLSTPIAINGPFVVELTDMKNSRCNFYVLAAREREGENYWGYHIEGDKETYHNKFTPAICVKAMFPALYPKEGEEKEVIIPSEGVTTENVPKRTIYANKRYNNDEFSCTTAEWCKVEAVKTTQDYVTFAFTAEANTTNNPREADFVISFRGKSLSYHLYQPPQGRTVVRNGLSKGNLGTICLPYKVKEITGASLWEIAYLTNNTLVLEETKTIEAGLPYIFQAEQERIEGIIMKNLTTTTSPTNANDGLAGAKNGLHGTFEAIRDKALEGKYVMANNEFVRCGSGCELGANRAYMVLEEVPTTATPAKEGIRRMVMKMGETTGLEFRAETIDRSEKPLPRKLFGADGRLYINVNGQRIGMDGQRL